MIAREVDENKQSLTDSVIKQTWLVFIFFDFTEKVADKEG